LGGEIQNGWRDMKNSWGERKERVKVDRWSIEPTH